MQSIPAATSPDDLGLSWLTGALRESGVLAAGRRVTGMSHEAVGTGQMCNSYRLELTYDGATEAPATIIAKLPSDDPGSRAAGQGMLVYRVEVSFYQQFATHLEIRTPYCYFAGIADNNIDFVLLLEDLAPAEQGNQLRGCTLSQAELAVREAVKLHAPLLGDPLLETLPWLNRESGALDGGFLTTLYPGFRARYAHSIDREILEMGERFMGKLTSYYGKNKGRRTLAHTDYRIDNMLFGTTRGGPPIAVVDWQTTSLGNPVSDIAYLLGASLEVDDRRRNEKELVRLYHRLMVEAGVEEFRFDDCWRDYRLYGFAGFHMAVLASMLVQRTDRGDEMFRVMAARHGRQILDLESEAML